MVPQLAMFRNDRNMQAEVRYFIGLRGSYIFFFILSWSYHIHASGSHYATGKEVHEKLVFASGVLQCLQYTDFWWYFARLLCRTIKQKFFTPPPPTDDAMRDATIPLLAEEQQQSEVDMVPVAIAEGTSESIADEVTDGMQVV